MLNDAELLQIEVALRDSRHTEVIMALDRLVLFPHTREEMQQSMEDLKKVKSFINNHLPIEFHHAAQAVFVEHGKAMKEHFLSPQNNKGE